MGTIIFLFVVIAIVTGGATLFYCKCIKMSAVRARKIEIVGYILLFIVLIWELVIKNLMMDDFYNANLYYLDQKLSCIFRMLEADLGRVAIDENAISNSFYSAVESELVQRQMICVNVIESALKIVSTVFIAVGRFQELLKGKDLFESAIK